jgi:5-methylcytosine-specific restriction enzyme subunit McrC
MMSRRLLRLKEVEVAGGVELTETDIDTLRRVVPSVRITPTLERPGCFDLVPGSVIGAITTDTFDIVISPKIPIDRLLFLLSYALDPKHWRPTTFDYAAEASIVDAIIPNFLAATEPALRRGLLQGYVSIEDALMGVRGRIRFDEQLRRRQSLPLPVEARWDDFTEDIEANRLLKAATRILRTLRPRSKAYGVRLRRLEAQLEPVTAIRYDPRSVPDPVITRLNSHYEAALRLARLIIQNTTFDVQRGRVTASAVLFDMNKVFEDFVVTALREALHLNQQEFPQGTHGRRLRLDASRQVRLKPDLSWWHNKQCLFVGDVKYKRITVDGTDHPDLYQLLAYTIATGLRHGLLVYAAGEATDITHKIPGAEKELSVRTLDLSGTPSDILQQVRRLAALVRSLSGTGQKIGVPVH